MEFSLTLKFSYRESNLPFMQLIRLLFYGLELPLCNVCFLAAQLIINQNIITTTIDYATTELIMLLYLQPSS